MTTTPPVVTALSHGPTADFPTLAGRYLDEYRSKIEAAVAPVDEQALWWRPAPGTNSIGNLMLHVSGNLSLWIEDGVGGITFNRDRAGEFRADRTHEKAQLIAALADVVARCQRTLGTLDPNHFDRAIAIQGYQTNVLGAVFHAVEHLSYHTGQILWAVKQILGRRPEGHGIELYPQHGVE